MNTRQKELFRAIIYDDLEKAKELIKDGATMNAQLDTVKSWGASKEMITLLSTPLVEKHEETEAEQDTPSIINGVSWKAHLQYTLIEAIKDNELEKVKELIKGGVDINVKNGNGWSSLHYAAIYNKPEIFEVLINEEANINAKDTWDFTPLHRASYKGNLEIIKSLLNKNADINIMNINNNTPLDIAKRENHQEIVELLEEATSEQYRSSRVIKDISISLADRFNKGKLQWSLVDFNSLESLVRVLEFGAEKYSPNNWKKGLEKKATLDCLMRHLIALMNNEELDKESGESHIGHIMANAMFYEHFRLKKENK